MRNPAWDVAKYVNAIISKMRRTFKTRNNLCLNGRYYNGHVGGGGGGGEEDCVGRLTFSNDHCIKVNIPDEIIDNRPGLTII